MNRAYFDHNATTPVSPEVVEAMVPVLLDTYGNASSIHHYGQAAKQRLEFARREIAALLHCGSTEIVFTSGGTESNNLAIFGIAGAGGHVITTSIEHPAVLSPCAELEHVTYVPVGPSGLVDPNEIRNALRADTKLISAMHVNNEVGTIQPIAEIAKIAQAAGVAFHVDGVQAAGKIPVDVLALGVDLYSVSGHKLNAPKGVGVLYVRRGLKLRPMLFGGRHERERRAGTENVPGAVALGRACKLVREDLEPLRDRLEQLILSRVRRVRVNGMGSLRVPNTTNLCFEGIEGEAMVISLDLRGFAVSSGSACSSGAVEPSHVLLAMGLSAADARSSLRFSLGRGNTVEQVDRLVDAVVLSAEHLRKLSPVYV